MRPLKHGFQPLLDHFHSKIPKNCLRLNSEVIKVEYLAESHLLFVDILDRIDETITRLSCDHIIWTTSIGYLQNNFSRIFATEGKLIEQKQAAINNFGFGTVNKVIT